MKVATRISRMIEAVRGALNSANRVNMLGWAEQVDRYVRSPPGCDDGFTAEQIHRYGRSDFSKLSTWQIVCEEVLDTAFPQAYFDAAAKELRQRGISGDEYLEMRRFAWLTAGWLNYVKMHWDWCNLDERDIKHAIESQFAEGWISLTERDRRLAYADKYAGGAAPPAERL